MRTPEEVAREVGRSFGLWLVEQDGLDAAADLIRARDAEVAEAARANDPILRAWVEPGINPPYHERMKARVRKIMPTLARHLDEKAKDAR